MTRLRWSTAGESHGPELLAIVEGIPAGLPLLAADVDGDLARRQRGYGRGGRMKIETDRVRLLAGVRGGETLGSPIALAVENRDHASWTGRMGPAPFPEPPEPLTRPRPGHADLAGGLKYDRHDLRDILERASARETAMRVAVGAVCRKLIGALGVEVFAHVVAIGPVEATLEGLPLPEIRERSQRSDLACADPVAEQAMRTAILEGAHAGDTLGGVFEVVATRVPPGLGSHVQWDRKLDGRLAQALMSIQAIKGVEIGLGFGAARARGSEVHDPIGYDDDWQAFTRPSNRAGGLEGGITNGMPVVCRAAMKPIATLRKALDSVDVRTKEAFEAAFERSDVRRRGRVRRGRGDGRDHARRGAAGEARRGQPARDEGQPRELPAPAGGVLAEPPREAHAPPQRLHGDGQDDGGAQGSGAGRRAVRRPRRGGGRGSGQAGGGDLRRGRGTGVPPEGGGGPRSGARGAPGRVLARGGGALIDPARRRAALAKARVVTLAAWPETVEARTAGLGRPLLGEEAGRLDRIRALRDARGAAYAEAHACVATDGLSVDEVAGEVLAAWARPAVAVPLGLRSYAVQLAAREPEVAAAAVTALRPSAVFVVTDETVHRLWGRRSGTPWRQRGRPPPATVVLAPGEAHKRLASVERALVTMVEAGADRDAVVVGMGGGVVTDVAGFTAAVLLRGVRWAAVPTTLLGMVDASVGGKTGVDLGLAKNAVGAFHQPSAVVVDVAHTTTETPRAYVSGLAEVVKSAAVGDPGLFVLLEQDPERVLERDLALVEEVVMRSVAVKAAIVARDERESGERALLNLGHTVGHALEAEGGFARLTHGEAVALGTVAALRVGEALGATSPALARRVTALLARLGLPTDLDAQPLDRALGLVALDKKRRGGALRFVLLHDLGDARIHEVAPSALPALLGGAEAPRPCGALRRPPSATRRALSLNLAASRAAVRLFDALGSVLVSGRWRLSMHVHLKHAGAALLLVAGACTLNAASGCANDDSSMFIAGCLAVARDSCTAMATATATFVGFGSLAGGLGKPYICAAQVENQLVPTGNAMTLQTETGRIVLQTADIEILDASGGVYTRTKFSPGAAKFTVPITGFIDVGDGTNPGLGVSFIEFIDSQTALDLSALAMTKGAQTVQVQVLLHGQSLGGESIHSQLYFLYPITVDAGSLCVVPPGEPCSGGTDKPNADCEPGQDEGGVDCRLFGASAADACQILVCTNNMLSTATCPAAGTVADMSCCDGGVNPPKRHRAARGAD